MIQVYQATDVGRVRQGNEDSVVVFEPSVYVVADGMGGEAAGEVASHLLVDTVRQTLAGSRDIVENSLRQAVLAANDVILTCVAETPAYQGMGTTATLLHIDEDERQACWAHVGDSRLYLLRDGAALQRVTRDHSYVEDLVAQGSITEDEAKVHPRRNLLTRAVGVDRDLSVDTGRLALKGGDVLLLATDGLMKHVSDEEIAELLLAENANPAQTLIQRALDAGGSDNITAVVVVCSA
ncbi:MAG: Stp1/IreP family PP2C-type Ser/Thr phosphatase [Selenomonas sp.]|nr:Stp1/IreP family PP2C-type Ser/Thr phosphatase [Selenomonas sp.]